MYLYAGYLSEQREFFITFSTKEQTSTTYLSEKEIETLELLLQKAKIHHYNSIINPISEIEKREIQECLMKK